MKTPVPSGQAFFRGGRVQQGIVYSPGAMVYFHEWMVYSHVPIVYFRKSLVYFRKYLAPMCANTISHSYYAFISGGVFKRSYLCLCSQAGGNEGFSFGLFYCGTPELTSVVHRGQPIQLGLISRISLLSY
jgi:hypothetical protein